VRRNLDGTVRYHLGVDINARRNRGVFAAESGKVSFVGERGNYGNVVEITLENKTVLRHAHLGEAMVTVGDKVNEGEVIGIAGTSGNAQGLPFEMEHLHFEVIGPNGQRIDPAAWLNDPNAPPPVTPEPKPDSTPDPVEQRKRIEETRQQRERTSNAN